jgi:acyl dehydratase
LLPRLSAQLMEIKKTSRGVNYGSNKVRFTGMVPAGSRVRMRSTLKAAEDVKGDGIRIIADVAMEMEGSDRPVMVAETISISYA